MSMLLAVLMVLSAMFTSMTVQVWADDSSEGDDAGNNGGTTNEDTTVVEDIDYLTHLFATPEEKLATMKLVYEKDGYQLYLDEKSGEVACVNVATGDKLFTNPYDVGASLGSEAQKYELLSQIIVRFKDNQGQDKVFTSYEQAVMRDQVVVENIKNGIRVEYTIGREQTKTLVPRIISKDRFDDIILKALEEAFGDELYNSKTESDEIDKIQDLLGYYVLYSQESLPSDEYNKKEPVFGGVIDGLENNDRLLTLYLDKYEALSSMPIYVFDPTASDAVVARCEEIILTYCPEYTYEELEFDHAQTNYESDDENPPVFRMALEYRLDAQGLTVRLPANGIRFNESLYTLEGIDVLPYMGAGNSGYSGYNFYPDGSGTLFDFEELNTTQTQSITGNIYGTDFAYHEITGTYQKSIRYPVFGIVEETTYHTFTDTDVETGEVKSEYTLAGAVVEAIRAYVEGEKGKVYNGNEGSLAAKFGSKMVGKETVKTKKRGFVAIIEEGDALTSLSTYHAGALNDYNTIKMSFIPRPKDSYNLQDSISVGTDSEWTVISERKYVGSYKMRYIMLTDTENTTVPAEGTYYDTSWLGMAIAYRDYLTGKKVISKLDAETLTEDIPLYIETFGTVETVEKILSIPVTVMAPLTTFEQVLEMYNDLSTDEKDEDGNVTVPGIKNINFKLTGYANGGMYYSVPGNLKFERAVGGKKGFQALLDEAARINGDDDKNTNLGIFPDFDFVYQIYDEWFNGYNNHDHAAKTIDDRYANRREYSATQQKYMNYYEIVISPAYFNVLYERLEKNYANKYQNVYGISVSTLGQWLNSDFDEDEPYNREDSKGFTVEAFEYFDKTYGQVMTEGGNAYVWEYVDHMLNVDLDSSRYNFSSCAVPFIGVVLHGSVSFTGEPLNMEGDLQYALLKAIENGASPYFILSMANTQALKEYFDLSEYYSIRYDIWKDDISDVYNVLNEVLSDVQDKYIIDHEFLTGERIPDIDELENDILNEYLADLDAENNAAEILANEVALRASQARKDGRLAEAYAAEALLSALSYYTSNSNNVNSALVFDDKYFGNAKKAYLDYYMAAATGDEAAEDRADAILDAVVDYNIPAEYFAEIYDAVSDSVNTLSAKLAANHAALVEIVVPATIKAYFTENGIAVDDKFVENLAKSVIEDFEGSRSAELQSFIGEELEDSKKYDADFVAALPKNFAKNIATDLIDYLSDDCGKTIISSAYSAYGTAINSLLSAIDKYSEDIAAYGAALKVVIDDYNSVVALADAQAALEAAQSAYDADPTDENKAALEAAKAAVEKSELYEALKAAKAAYDATVEGDDTLEALEKAYYEAVIAVADAIEAVNEAKANVEAAQKAYDEAEDGVAAMAETETEAESESESETETEKVMTREELAAELEAAKKAYDDAVNAVFALAYLDTLDTTKTALDDYLEAGDEDAKAALDKAIADYKATLDEEIVDAIDKAEQTAMPKYISAENSLADANYKVNTYVPALSDIANDYMMTVAAASAKKLVIKSGFKLDYNRCLEIYFQYEKNTNYFKTFQKLAQAGNLPSCVADVVYGGFDAYVQADLAKIALEAECDAIVAAKNSGSVDSYTSALAKLAALKELGYNAEDATEEQKKEYTKAENSCVSTRKAAITAMARLDGYNLKQLASILETTQMHLNKATEAVSILAEAEGSFTTRIVEQAKDRANAVNEYLNGNANFIAVEDGRLSDYVFEVDGEEIPLYYVRNKNSEIRYFYGTKEAGYTYLVRNEDGSFAIAERGLNDEAQPTGSKWNGLNVYSEGSTYFVTTLEGTDEVAAGYTYLTYNKYYNIYEVREATVYNGSYVDSLEDGTKVYFDKSANVYYSVNADGTYTRYDYYMSISQYYNLATNSSKEIMAKAYDMIAGCEGLDETFKQDVQARIDRENANVNVEEEEEEEETVSKYTTENIVAVTYGNADNTAYKTVLLNYNNYSVKVVYNGIEYTIEAYDFVVVMR